MSRPVTEEYLQHCFATFAQQLEAVLERKFGEVDKKFGEVDKKFGEVKREFGEVDKRFGEVKREVKREFGEINRIIAEQDTHWEQRLRAELDNLREEMHAGFTGIHDRLDQWLPQVKPEPATVHLLIDE